MLEQVPFFVDGFPRVVDFISSDLLEQANKVVRGLLIALQEASLDLGREVRRLNELGVRVQLLSLATHYLHVMIEEFGHQIEVCLSRRHHAQSAFDEVE